MNFTLKIKKHIFLFAGLVLTLSCSKDDPEHIHDHDEITHVTLVIEASNEPTQTIVWDNDSQTPETIILKANTNYSVAISFTNEEVAGEIENITLEIIEEADVHQVFYEFSSVDVNVTTNTNDTTDSNGFPVLINSIWNANTVGTGVVRTYLIHEPSNKNATNRDGIGGFNDVSIDIPINVIE